MHQRISNISASATSVHHQHQCTAGSVHQQDQCISRISALAGSVHQKDQRISSISASAHQQLQRISSISASAASAHQQHQQHQRISSISILAASVACTGRDICPYTSINSDHISLYTLTPPDTTRHASDTTRHHQTCIRHHQTPPDMHQTISDRLAVVLWWFIGLYRWSRFFLPTGERANGRTKVFQEVLADLKRKCVKMENPDFEVSFNPILSRSVQIRIRPTPNQSDWTTYLLNFGSKCANLGSDIFGEILSLKEILHFGSNYQPNEDKSWAERLICRSDSFSSSYINPWYSMTCSKFSSVFWKHAEFQIIWTCSETLLLTGGVGL